MIAMYQILSMTDDPEYPTGLVKSEDGAYFYYQASERQWVNDPRVSVYFNGTDNDGFFADESEAALAMKKLNDRADTRRVAEADKAGTGPGPEPGRGQEESRFTMTDVVIKPGRPLSKEEMDRIQKIYDKINSGLEK